MPEVTRVVMAIRLRHMKNEIEVFRGIAEEFKWKIYETPESGVVEISVLVRYSSRRAALAEGEREVTDALEGLVDFVLEDVAVARNSGSLQATYRATWRPGKGGSRGRIGRALEKTGLFDADLKVYRHPAALLENEVHKLGRRSVPRQAGWTSEGMSLRTTGSPKISLPWSSKVPVLPWWRSKTGALQYTIWVAVAVAGTWAAVNFLPSWALPIGVVVCFILTVVAGVPLRRAWDQSWAAAILGAAIFVALGTAVAFRMGDWRAELYGFVAVAVGALLLEGAYFSLTLPSVRKVSKVFITGFLSLALISPWAPGFLWGVYADKLKVPEDALAVTTTMRLLAVAPYALSSFAVFAFLFSLVGWGHYFRVLPFVGDAWMRILSAMMAISVIASLVVAAALSAYSDAQKEPDKALKAAVSGEAPKPFAGLSLKWVCLTHASPSVDSKTASNLPDHPVLLVPTTDARVWTWDLVSASVKEGSITGSKTEGRAANTVNILQVASSKQTCPR